MNEKQLLLEKAAHLLKLLAAGNPLTHIDFRNGDYVKLDINREVPCLADNTGEIYALSLLQQVSLDGWSVWTKPAKPLFAVNEIVFDTSSEQLVKVLNVDFSKGSKCYVYYLDNGSKKYGAEERFLKRFN